MPLLLAADQNHSAGANTSKRARTDDVNASNAAEGSCTLSQGSKHQRVPSPVKSSDELATKIKSALGVHSPTEKGCNIRVSLHLHCFTNLSCMLQHLAHLPSVDSSDCIIGSYSTCAMIARSFCIHISTVSSPL